MDTAKPCLPASADPNFIPLKMGERLSPEQLKALFPNAQRVFQQMAIRVAEMQATETVEVAS